MDINALIQSSGGYGPWVVFLLLLASGFGIPIGEEVVNVPAGFLIAKGKMNLWWTLVASYTGIILADMLWFAICRRYATRLLHWRFFRRLIHPKRILQAKHQVERWGALVMVIARFIPSSRTAAITVSGMLHLEWWKFILIEVTCVAITAPLQLGLGYLIGIGVTTESTATLVLWLIGIVIVVALLPIVIGWFLRWRLNHDEIPRAKMRWLRRFRRKDKLEVELRRAVKETDST